MKEEINQIVIKKLQWKKLEPNIPGEIYYKAMSFRHYYIIIQKNGAFFSVFNKQKFASLEDAKIECQIEHERRIKKFYNELKIYFSPAPAQEENKRETV